MTVRVPGVAIQLRVARILTGYDELIDNNRRRIKLLEDSARLLFDEWFIRGHLPPMHLQSADVGEARHFSLAHICDDVKNPVLPEQLDSDVPYIGLEHMPRRSFTLGEWGSAADISSMKLRYLAGDIVFGKIRPYFHKVGIALTDGICSSDAIVMRAKSPHWQYLLLALVSSDEFIGATAQAMKEGSKMPRADGKQMMAYPVSVPNGGVLEAFNNHVEPIIEQVKALAFQVRKLRTARDLLLPRLMSGQLSV